MIESIRKRLNEFSFSSLEEEVIKAETLLKSERDNLLKIEDERDESALDPVLYKELSRQLDDCVSECNRLEFLVIEQKKVLKHKREEKEQNKAISLLKNSNSAAKHYAKLIENDYESLVSKLIEIAVGCEICDELARKARLACQDASIPFDYYQAPEQLASNGDHWRYFFKEMVLPDPQRIGKLWPNNDPMKEALKEEVLSDFEKRGFIEKS